MGSDEELNLHGRMRDITPAMATKWLEGKVHNRPVRDGKVQEYAADMKAGRWRATHQGIAFNPAGELIDGQHRLWAVVEANVTVRMMVTENVPAESMIAFDGGLPRTLTDVIQIDDPESGVTSRHTACARAMIFGVQARSLRTPTRQEVRDFINLHWPAITFSVAGFQRKIRGISRAQVYAVIARGWYDEENRERVERFSEVLQTGVMVEPCEEVVIKLRNWLLGLASGVRAAGGSKASKLSSENSMVYGKTQRALQALIRRESVGQLYAATDEVFLLPEEKKRLPKSRRKAG